MFLNPITAILGLGVLIATLLFDIGNYMSFWARALMGPAFASVGMDDEFNTLISYASYAGDLIPLWECASIIFAGYAAATTIRVVRYVVGWIPGVEG